MAAGMPMYSLSPVEREAVNDSLLKIQSIQRSLDQVEEFKIPAIQEIRDCLTTAHKNLRAVLRRNPA
jgi:hypothetical protein